MLSAHEAFDDVVATWDAADPRVPLLSNADGAVVTDAREVLRRLSSQIISPVRWDLCQAALGAAGSHPVTGLVELAPGGVLAGLARRTLPDVARVAIKSPDDLEGARALVAEHGEGVA
ncbi:hypothetical protein GCM10025875_10070 [Litorihabitans aurantiacus]|uniref:[acyl-carrier-protein] S-malonyltransferase n=1 Tax=Litorihabitans aurantiacus TaxID=1930061 RepID=A0AA37UM45_9MICO|nr:hypothetical protein GCM10025875_10070 [Litorihabitans aurantiacus]